MFHALHLNEIDGVFALNIVPILIFVLSINNTMSLPIKYEQALAMPVAVVINKIQQGKLD
jgi:hypothetical protein